MFLINLLYFNRHKTITMSHLLILGASGVLGSAATKYFLKTGFTVTAFVRNKNKAADLEKSGAKLIIGDLTNPGSIKDCCKNMDVVITAAHGMLGKGKNKSQNIDETGHRLLIDEALQSGVKHFIYTSVNNASENHPIDFFRTKYVIEQYLVNSGLNYTILRLPAFMEWHVYNLLGKNIVQKGKTTILGKGMNPTNFIAVKDIVAALDKIILDENYYNKLIPVAGPQNLTKNKIAELFGKALNIKPKIGHVPVGVLKLFSVLFQPVHPGVARIMKLAIATEQSDETMNVKNSIEQFGLIPTNIEEFIQNVISNNPSK